MRRYRVLGGLVLAGLLSTMTTYEARQERASLAVTEIDDNLYMLGNAPSVQGMGGGGNTAIFVTANGVALVDTKIKGYGQDILDAVLQARKLPGSTPGAVAGRSRRPHREWMRRADSVNSSSAGNCRAAESNKCTTYRGRIRSFPAWCWGANAIEETIPASDERRVPTEAKEYTAPRRVLTRQPLCDRPNRRNRWRQVPCSGARPVRNRV